jgi:hypothetical protein
MPDRSVERGAPRQCPLNAALNGRAKKTFSAASRTSDRSAAEQKRIGWEMAVRIEKILYTVQPRRRSSRRADPLADPARPPAEAIGLTYPW